MFNVNLKICLILITLSCKRVDFLPRSVMIRELTVVQNFNVALSGPPHAAV